MSTVLNESSEYRMIIFFVLPHILTGRKRDRTRVCNPEAPVPPDTEHLEYPELGHRAQ